MIKITKELDAPVEYDDIIQSYVYTEEVGLAFRFYKKKRGDNKIQHVLC